MLGKSFMCITCMNTAIASGTADLGWGGSSVLSILFLQKQEEAEGKGKEQC